MDTSWDASERRSSQRGVWPTKTSSGTSVVDRCRSAFLCNDHCLSALTWENRAIFAVFGVVVSVAFWMVELISLDATDIALQARLGPVMLIAVVWILTSETTAAGIYWDARGPRDTFESNTNLGGLT